MKFRLFERDKGLSSEGFNHRDIRGALDPETYTQLSDRFPLDQFPDVRRLDNEVLRLSAGQLIDDPRTADIWREFMAYLISQEFWRDLVETFGEDFRSAHPQLEEQAGRKLEDWKVSRRGERGGDIVLEAFAVINTPVRSRPTHVKGTHIDQAMKLFTGLLYMRSENDETPGGQLELYRPVREPVFDSHQIPRSRTVPVKTVPYEANRFVGFVNSIEAIHAVGSRPITPHIRRYIDLVAELPRGKVFKVPQMNPISRLAYRLTERESTRERTGLAARIAPRY